MKKKMKKKMKDEEKWMRDIRWPWRVKTLDRLHDPTGGREILPMMTGTLRIPQSTSKLGAIRRNL